MKVGIRTVYAWILTIAMVFGFMGTVSIPVSADDNFLKADEQAEGDYTQATTTGKFTIMASADKKVTVDANEKTADDGESFTKRIKLGGTGKADYRSIHFTASGTTTVTVYALSGSSSEDRDLGLFTTDGVQVTSFKAPGTGLVAASAEVGAGDYYLASLNSGINVYGVKLTGEGSAPVVRKAWNEITAPVITSAVQEGDAVKVTFQMITGNDGADLCTVTLYNDKNEAAAEATAGKSTETTREVTLKPIASGTYRVKVAATRAEEAEAKTSAEVETVYSLPLAVTAVSASNAGSGSLKIEWVAVEEATSYVVECKAQGSDTFVKAAETAELSATISGFAVGTTVEVRVLAVRGNDSSTSESISKQVKQDAERVWKYTYFGQSSSEALNTIEMIDENNLTFKLNSCSVKADGTIDKKGGKFTTFHDGISYYYTEVDPKAENFTLTATFTLDYINTTPDGQEGFGLVAMDSLGEYGVASVNHYTNSASIIATKFESTINGTKYTSKDTIGFRQVSGITELALASGDTGIAESGKNVSEAFSYAVEDLVKAGESYTLTLKKTNTGFEAYVNNDSDKTQIMYNADKLLQLDKDKIYVGFAAARGCNVTVSNVSFTVSNPATDPAGLPEPAEQIEVSTKVDCPTTASERDYMFVFTANADGKVTITDAVGSVLAADADVVAGKDMTAMLQLKDGVNDYTVAFTPAAGYVPGENQVLKSFDTVTIKHSVEYRTYEGAVLYVTQEGTKDGNGSKASPLDLDTAAKYIQPGQTIELAGGTYMMTSGFIIARGNNGTQDARKVLRSAEGERAVLNFSQAKQGMQVWGDYWTITGIDVCETTGNVKGLQIAGDNNIISLVNTYRNGDTGLQISGTGSETFEKWPSNNLILNCTSYDNCDPGMNNADGFAAKLTCGEGNVFRGCIAHHNLDDGWDLFSKIESGPIGSVVIENCIAYQNGTLTTGVGDGDGNGFKMGGDGIAVPHIIRNSISFANNAAGITSNSDPAIIVENCTSYGNKGINVTLYGKGADAERSFSVKGLISMAGGSADNYSEMPQLAEDETNYFFNGSKTVNKAGTELTADIFVSTDTAIVPERAQDGSINMKGLLQLKNAGNTGAVLASTADTSSKITVSVTGDTYTVQQGDYLCKIAKNVFGDESAWTKLYELNKDGISDPNVLRVGQVLKLK